MKKENGKIRSPGFFIMKQIELVLASEGLSTAMVFLRPSSRPFTEVGTMGLGLTPTATMAMSMSMGFLDFLSSEL